jgi:hypothetical protein
MSWKVQRMMFIRTGQVLIAFMVSVSCAQAQTVTVGRSDEVHGNNATGRTLAAALDDSWAGSFTDGVFSVDLFSGNSSGDVSGSKIFTDTPANNSYRIDWTAGIINDSGPGLPTSTTFSAITVPSADATTIAASTNLQAGAPNPFSSINRLSTSMNSGDATAGGDAADGLNAIRLDFTMSTTPITDIGFFIGDTESRPNNGTNGRVLVFDTAGSLMTNGDFNLVYNGDVQNPGDFGGPFPYPVTEAPGSPSGPTNNDNSTGYWGNETTAFLDFSADAPIGSIIVSVGDDDHTSSNDGTTEQLAITGLQLPDTATVAPPADADWDGSVTGSVPAGATVTVEDATMPANDNVGAAGDIVFQDRVVDHNDTASSQLDIDILDVGATGETFTTSASGDPGTTAGSPTGATLPVSGRQTIAGVGFDASFDDTAGLKTGTITLTDTNSTGLDDTADDVLNVSGNVFDPSNASFSGSSDVDSLTLDFGTHVTDSGVIALPWDLFNLEDTTNFTLALDFDSIDPDLAPFDTGTDASLTDIAAGDSAGGFVALFDTTGLADGLFSETFELTLRTFDDGSVLGADNLGLQTLNLTLTGRIAPPVPEPPTLILLGAAIAGLGVIRRRRRLTEGKSEVV